jgi:ubiquinone biosynthesis protein UbiJ
VLGDVAAHQLGRAARGSARWGRRAHDALLRHVEEFIHEEARLAPPRLEVEDFLADLRATAQRGERLEAGIRRLGRRIDALAARDRTRRG